LIVVSCTKVLRVALMHLRYICSQLEIDDRYATCYGQFDFDVEKFPNASQMVRRLHDRGFRVTTWITPFSNFGCPPTAEGAAKMFWIANSSSPKTHAVPALTQWCAALKRSVFFIATFEKHWLTNITSS